MMRIGESLTRLARVLPAVFEPRDAGVMKSDCPASELRIMLDSRLPPDQTDESADRNRNDPQRKLPLDREPDRRRNREKHDQPKIPDGVLRRLQSRQTFFALRK